MTVSKQTFKIKLPFTMYEFRRGQIYTLCRMMREDVSIIKHSRSKDGNLVRTESIKELNLSPFIPSAVKSVIPTKACIVEEFSTSIEAILEEDAIALHKFTEFVQNDEHLVDEHFKRIYKKNSHDCLTVYKNKYYSEKSFRITITTKVNTDPNYKVEDSHVKEIDFRTLKSDISLLNVGSRDYTGDWHGKFPVIYVYKTVEIEVNVFGLGWVSSKINKGLSEQLLEFQTNLIKWYDEWKNLSDDELEELENDMIKKFYKKIN
ncbi:hypothetical protein HERIO_1309 [Hepatospora eriocheir]|uniref:Phosphatidylinositol transfer protein N-terminal domain-containing protein n=1 Tax=Hepatospora eriocheir TaxID=1081669 RepID=A0A1X0QAH7_9MICR|nr:hypothetical protein HERIO_1309 [Hepatospora eriocheir]